ncbi:MAG: fibronectin type III domain-containing protein, partial [Vicinamibacterales bacterium]
MSRLRTLVALLVATIALCAPAVAQAQTPVEAGFRDFAFGASANTTPTGEKPQSKLWFNDGSWWGSLFSPAAGVYRIHEFNPNTQTWTDTGTTLDTRPTSKADALWDQASQRLYLVSAPFSTSGSAAGSSANWGKLFRYSYSITTRTYALDPGFPVDVSRGKPEAITIAKDFAGKLWVTYVEDGKVKINWSLASDSSWSTPIDLPVSPSSTINVDQDDISDIIALGNGDIGVAWSNQSALDNRTTHFVVHRASDPPTTWQAVETVMPGTVCASGLACADDHLNMKLDSSGRVWMAMKTSLDTIPEPMIVLGVREVTGVWTTYTVTIGDFPLTRPIVLLDEARSKVYVFATSPSSGGTIYMKTSSMTNISFTPGLGTPFIQSSLDAEVNNASSTKQNVSAATGLLVIASEQNTLRYLHNFTWLGGGPPTTPPAPTSLLATAMSPGQVHLAWTDMSENEAAFEIERSSGGGAFALVGTAVAEAQSFEDLTVNPVTAYTYRVRAVNSAGDSAYSNTASTTTPAPAGAGNLKVISFENGSLTDSSTGVDTVVGTVALQTAPPLKETFSARINGATSYVEEDITATSDLRVTFYLKLNALPTGDVQLLRILNGGTAAGNLLLRSNGQLRLRDNATTVGLDSAQLVVGQMYRVGVRQKTGATDGILEAYLVPGDTEFGSPFAQTNAALIGLNANRIRLGAITAVAGDLVVDDIKLDNTALPGPSGPAPPAPTAPETLTAVAPTGTAVQLTWTDSSTTETAFHIERSLGLGVFAEIATVAPNTVAFTDSTVAPATDYNYRIRAVNAGGFSPYSNTAPVTTPQAPPAAPGGLVAVATQNAMQASVTVTWTDLSTTEASFSLERADSSGIFVEIGTVGANATGYFDTTVLANTSYTYRVRASNLVGFSDYSNVAAVTTPPTPVPPTAPVLSATASAYEVHVMWTDTSTNETAFLLERAGANGVFSEIGVASADVTFYDDGTVIPATAYSYRVRALNIAGYSAYSNVVTIAAPAEPVPPAIPTGLGASAPASNQVQLLWSDNSVTETSFSIERATGAGEFAEIGTVAANVTTFTDSTVAGSTAYSYKVRAIHAAAASDYSNTATVSTPAANASATMLKFMTFEGAALNDATTGADTVTGAVTFETAAPLKDAKSAKFSATSAYLTEDFTAATDVYLNFYFKFTAVPSSNARIAAIMNGNSYLGNLTLQTTRKLRLKLNSTTIGSDSAVLSVNTLYRVQLHVRQAAGAQTRLIEAFVATGEDAFTTPFASGTNSFSGSPTRVRVGNTSGSVAAIVDDVRIDSGATTPTAAPSAPTALVGSALASNAVQLNWTDTSTTEATMRVERSDNGGAFAEIASLTADVTSYVDSAVTPSTNYSYRVRAVNTAGSSGYSNTVNISTPEAPVAPSDPTDLTATATTGQITLSWTDTSNNESEFHIERQVSGGAFVEFATVGADVTSFVDGTVASETTYGYRVRAANGSFSGYTNEASATTPAVPPMGPSALAAVAQTHTVVQLSWVDGSTNETGFKIERAGSNGIFAEIASVAANTTSFTNTGLTAETQYSYRVRAFNVTGDSQYSNVAPVTTLPAPVPPPAPTGLTAVAQTTSSIHLAWIDPGTTETSLRIERAGGNGIFAEIATVAANVVSFTDTTAASATTYSYRVRGNNEAGFGTYSNVATATTPAPPVPPGAPTGLSATASSSTQVQLSWSDTSVTETGFSIERAGSNGIFAEVGTVAADGTSYLDTGLTAGTLYSYRVRAINLVSASAYSNTATLTTPSSTVATQVHKLMTFENASVTDAVTGADSKTGTVVFESVAPINGVRSGKITTASSYLQENFTASLDFNLTFYLKLTALPSGEARYLQIMNNGTTVGVLAIQTTGALRLKNNATAVAPDSAPLVVGTVYRVNVHQRQAAGAATRLLEAYLAVGDAPFGAPFASTTAGTWTGGADRIRLGNTSGTSATVFDDVKVEGEAPTPTAAPTAPSGLGASSVASTSVQVSWLDNATTEANMKLERSTNGGAFAEIAVLGANVTAYTDTAVAASTSYAYRVRASNVAGDSAYSNTASVTTPAAGIAPNAPTGLGFTLTLGSVSLTWTDNSSDETGFFIERADSSGVFAGLGVVGADVTAYTDSTVAQDTQYSYRVRAANASYSAYSNEVTLTTIGAPPVDPTGLTATAPTSSAVQLAWVDASTSETEFHIERAGSNGVFAEIATVAANTATFSDTTVAESTAYTYRVRAAKNVTFSGYSNVAAVTTPAGVPSAPTNLGAASTVSTIVELTWTDASGTETAFHVERTTDGEFFDEIALLPANATSFNDTTVSPAHSYGYRVRAENGVGFSAYSAMANVSTPQAPPSAPASLIATVNSPVQLTWTDTSTTEEAFHIERATGAGAFAEIATVGTNVTTYVDSTGAAETTYSYRVRAGNTGGYSAYTATVTVTTLPPAPTGLTAVAPTSSAVNLAWTDASASETGFSIERATGAGAFVEIAVVAPNTTAYADATVLSDTAYTYRVRAASASGNSAYTNDASLTTPTTSPSGLVASSSVFNAVQLSWTDTATLETAFHIERSINGGAFVEIGVVAANVTTYTDNGTSELTLYSYRVRALAPTGFSGYSDAASVTTPVAPPAAPTGLGAEAPTSVAVNLTWTDASATETGFHIERKTGAEAFVEVGTVGAGVTVYTDSTVAAETAYVYRVRAVNAAGFSDYTVEATVTTPVGPPVAPNSLTATAPTIAAVQLAWTDASSNETGFHVERSVNGGAFVEIATVGSDVTSYTDNTVSAETSYSYRVRAVNVGGFSAYSTAADVTIRPPAPGGLAATAPTSGSVLLTWTDNLTSETAFHIERAGGNGIFAEIATVGADVNTYTDTTVTPETGYSYRIRAANAGGLSAYSSGVAVTTQPPAPSALIASNPSTTSVQLAWTDNSTSETGFRIERSTNGGAFVEVGTALASATTFTDTTGVADTNYSYQVRASSATGFSAYSTTASATTIPNAPTALTAGALSGVAVQLSWNDPSATETGFHIERAGSNGIYAEIATVGANVTIYTDTTVTPTTAYSYRVRVTNAGGNSAYSNVSGLTTPMAAPTALVATSPSGTEVLLTWTDNSTNETTFHIERSLNGGPFVEVATLGTDATGYTDGEVVGGTPYAYRVRANGAFGFSAYSNEVSVTTLSAPIAPTGLTASSPAGTIVELSWTDTSNAETNLLVERAGNGSGFTLIATLGQNVTSYTDTTVIPSTLYQYRVRAANIEGNSPYSNQANVTTLMGTPAGLTATAPTMSAVDLSWTNTATGNTSVRVERSVAGGAFVEIASLAPTATSYSDTAVSAETAYSYRVRAANGEFSAYSTVASVTTPPPAPAGLTATTPTSSAAQLSWTDTSSTETAFHIERSVNSGAWTEIGTVAANVTTYVDNTTTELTDYSYRVRAENAGGLSAASATASVTTPIAPPAAATALTATVPTAGTVQLTWIDGSSTETGFHIERSTGAGAWTEIGTVASDVTTYADTTVASETDYSYRVRAANVGGLSGYSNVATVTTTPATPTGLVATALTHASVQLTWTDASAAETTVHIDRSVNGGAFVEIGSVAANVTTYVDTTATEVTAYTYRVRTVNAAGSSAPSTVASATTPLSPPSSLAATAPNMSSVVLTWTDTSGAEAAFYIERSEAGGPFVEVGTIGQNAVSYTDGTVAPNTTYTYRVKVGNVSGFSVFSNTAVVTTPAPPAAPTALTAVAPNHTTVNLAWTDNATTETAFHVDRSVNGGSFSEIAVLGPNVTVYTDNTVSATTSYSYRVRAANAEGFSLSSNQANVTTPMETPTGLTAAAPTFSAVLLTWTDNSIVESSFKVERSTNGGPFSQIASVAANSTSYSDAAVAAENTYAYRVRGANGTGFSAYSAEVTVTTRPEAPTDLTAAAPTSVQAVLGWTDAASTEVSYRIERSVGGGAFVEIASVGPNTTSYTDTATTELTTYSYRIRVENAGGFSTYSTQANVTTPIAAPLAPTALSASIVSGSVVLSWTDAATTETGFKIERKLGAGAFTQIGTVGADITTFTDATVVSETAYAYRVRATNAGGDSAFSPEAAATTAPSTPTGLVATASVHNAVQLTWTDSSTTETEFRIERAIGAGAFAEIATVGANTNVYTDGTVVEATAYSYRVRASNTGGTSAASVAATVTTPVAPPSSLVATAPSGNAVQLNWTDGSAHETTVRIERAVGAGAFEEIAAFGADVITFTDGSVAPSTTYSYRVRAGNVLGFSVYSNTSTVTTPAPPAAPTLLTGSATAYNTVQLSWTDNSANETGFQIQRAPSGGSFALVGTVGPDVTTYADTTAAGSTNYSYRVRAINLEGNSAFTNQVNVSTPMAPPSGLTASAPTLSAVELTWTDATTGELSIRIEKSTAGGPYVEIATLAANSTTYTDTAVVAETAYSYRARAANAGGFSVYSNLADVTTPPTAPAATAATASTANSVVVTWTDTSATETAFHIERAVGAGAFAEVGTVAGNVTTFTDATTSEQTSYNYRVRALGPGGHSAFSGTAAVTTPAVAPAVPTGLSASSSVHNSVQLTWADASANETGFHIERAPNGGSFVEIGTVAADVVNYTDTTVVGATAYTYRVRAVRFGTFSGYSNTADVTTPVAPPSAPSGLTATALTGDSIQVSWTDTSSTETSFHIERAPLSGGAFVVVGTTTADATSFVDTTVAPVTGYTYRVRAQNASGYSAYSGFADATTPIAAPVAPSGLTATAPTNSAVLLTWTDNATTEASYKVERSVAGGPYTVIALLGPDVISYTDTAVTAEVSYSYRVRAANVGGNSAYANGASVLTPAPAPTALTATAPISGPVHLSWTDTSTTETSFHIERSTGGAFTEIGTVGPNVTVFTDSAVDPETAYSYRVTAVNAGGPSAYSNVATVTTQPLPPTAPTSLSVVAPTSVAAQLTWTDASTSETGFTIERSVEGGAFVEIGTAPANATAYTDTTTQPVTTYGYRVRAVNAGGPSANSNEASVTTPVAAPAAPTGLSATATSASTIDLAWSDVATETSFHIERSTAGGPFVDIATVGADVTTFGDSGLTPETAYTYRVVGYNAGGPSVPSTVASATTPLAPPAAPSALSVAAPTAVSAQLTWVDESATEAGFRIERSVNSGPFVQIAAVGADVTTYSDATTEPETTYAYRVRAFNAGGTSAYSNEAGVTTPIAAPAVPTALAATSSVYTSVQLSWSDNSMTETAVHVERQTGAGAWTEIAVLAAETTSYIDTAVTESTDYNYRVRAANAGGFSAYSATASVTTPPAPPTAPTGLGVTAPTSVAANLTWTDTSMTETIFHIERSANGGAFVEIGTAPANATAYTDTTTQPETAYAYKVRAANTGGMSDFSNEAAVTTPVAAPDAATGLAATAAVYNQVQLTWTDVATTEAAYHVERQTGAGPWVEIAVLAADSFSYTDGTTSQLTSYNYRVRTANAGGFSAYSNVAGVSTPVAPPEVPTSFTASASASNSVQLAWTDESAHETGFEISRAPSGGSFAVIASVGANVTAYT